MGGFKNKSPQGSMQTRQRNLELSNRSRDKERNTDPNLRAPAAVFLYTGLVLRRATAIFLSSISNSSVRFAKRRLPRKCVKKLWHSPLHRLDSTSGTIDNQYRVRNYLAPPSASRQRNAGRQHLGTSATHVLRLGRNIEH